MKLSHGVAFMALVLSSVYGQEPQLKHDDPTPIMILKEGYPCEVHTVVTEDCYILEMHRIPHGKDDDPDEDRVRPPVLLQHGLLGSSADWVMAAPTKSLGYILADAGYDVWLGNIRGNTYSRAHCTLDPAKMEFWQFSFDQMGKHDLYTMIQTVQNITGQRELFYGGHSMGTTSFMVFANEYPEMQADIRLATFLAPVAYVDHMKSPVKYLAPYVDSIEWIADMIGLGEFLPSNVFMDWIVSFFCHEGNLQGICNNIIFVLCGFDEAQVNATLLETIMHHTPAGASTNTLVHYAQEINSGTFSAFDYGQQVNQDIYGSDDPPEYNLELVTAPVALYWSENDWLAQPNDVLRLASALPNLFSQYQVPYHNWNHLDFIYGIDADKLVYPEVLENMNSIAFG